MSFFDEIKNIYNLKAIADTGFNPKMQVDQIELPLVFPKIDLLRRGWGPVIGDF